MARLVETFNKSVHTLLSMGIVQLLKGVGYLGDRIESGVLVGRRNTSIALLISALSLSWMGCETLPGSRYVLNYYRDHTNCYENVNCNDTASMGTDFYKRYGQPVYAAAGGRLVQSTYFTGSGNSVSIDHGLGIITIYGHFSKRNEKLKPGDVVTRNTIIGYEGDSWANSRDIVHTHFGILVPNHFAADYVSKNPKGKIYRTVNPEKYIVDLIGDESLDDKFQKKKSDSSFAIDMIANALGGIFERVANNELLENKIKSLDLIFSRGVPGYDEEGIEKLKIELEKAKQIMPAFAHIYRG